MTVLGSTGQRSADTDCRAPCTCVAETLSSDADAWCYELYALPGIPGRNDYIEFRIPDLTPNGLFTPAPAAQVTLLAHGEPQIPWPVLTQLIELMREYGDLVDDQRPKT